MQDGASNISNYTNKNRQNTSATCWWADLFFNKNPTCIFHAKNSEPKWELLWTFLLNNFQYDFSKVIAHAH